jgi:hypothetical protein
VAESEELRDAGASLLPGINQSPAPANQFAPASGSRPRSFAARRIERWTAAAAAIILLGAAAAIVIVVLL